MYDFTHGWWEHRQQGLYKLTNVEGIVAYILPHIDTAFNQIGFNYVFWVYKKHRNKRIVLFHDYSVGGISSFELTEEKMYNNIMYYLENE